MSSSSTGERTQRSERLSLRATTEQQQLIRTAAASEDMSMTDFVLDSATANAERVLADRRWFVLSEDELARFEEMIDAPVEHSPKLAALLTEPTVFDE